MNGETDRFKIDLQVGDLGIKLFYNVPQLQPTKYFEESELQSQLELHLNLCEEEEPFFPPPYDKFYATFKKIGPHELRLLLCYLAGFHSKVYDSVHGCGMVVQGKGVLLVGGNKSGKSTMNRMFSGKFRSSTLDDDLLMVDGSTMYVSGKVGGLTLEYYSPKEKEWYKKILNLDGPNVIRSHPIHAVFLLYNHREGGFIKEHPSFIPRPFAAFFSNPNLLFPYLDLPQIQVDAPVYLIGTNFHPEKTREAIESVL